MLAKNKFPLTQPDIFHDACGIGFITEKSGTPSRRVVELSIKALIRMQHRGGVGADHIYNQQISMRISEIENKNR